MIADISLNIARKELKIAQIAPLNQLFQLLHLVHIYGHGFYELSGMLMRKNVNSDVSKDSPINSDDFGGHLVLRIENQERNIRIKDRHVIGLGIAKIVYYLF